MKTITISTMRCPLLDIDGYPLSRKLGFPMTWCMHVEHVLYMSHVQVHVLSSETRIELMQNKNGE
ncbi:hypothetical protein I7I50_00630 [Histoplasma capsulatum G186AR]|uniref:Uncharacterized protein n=1 Tax=Ajellomyces capsulatus TaxID=5037 RepID=A0A8H7YJP1_AJECA|nr:hypothetical protein I7I52_07898 [Histoplasma capsulatum]QSS72702.1 hypothetical protein I7I50_00630 [Histoplasma capsulatum G186AR]